MHLLVDKDHPASHVNGSSLWTLLLESFPSERPFQSRGSEFIAYRFRTYRAVPANECCLNLFSVSSELANTKQRIGDHLALQINGHMLHEDRNLGVDPPDCEYRRSDTYQYCSTVARQIHGKGLGGASGRSHPRNWGGEGWGLASLALTEIINALYGFFVLTGY